MSRAANRLGAGPLVTGLDIAGTFVFAIEGARAAIFGRLDLLGVLVLGFITALGGGILRDLLLGAAPPAALRDWRYPALALAGAALVFLFWHALAAVPPFAITALDAAGLSLFAVAGTEKALDYKIQPVIAPFLGTITAAGGGVMRDVLLNQVPAVLRADIYATAALAGGAALVLARQARLSPGQAALAGFAVCFLLRLAAVRLHWHLPVDPV
jgi:uncharacterized membrane protein YeiH